MPLSRVQSQVCTYNNKLNLSHFLPVFTFILHVDVTMLTNMTIFDNMEICSKYNGGTMKALNIADAKAKLSEVITDAEYKGGRTIIARRNKPAAVVIGYDDFRKLEALEDIYESKLLEESLKKGRFLSLEDVAKRLKIEL